jgi:nitrogen fixation NifU-like protein
MNYDLRELYEEMILEHNRNPRNYPKKPEGCNHSAHGFNPLCGDEFFLHLKIEDGVIKDVGFEGAGCALSTASASVMTETILGKTLEEAEAIFRQVHEMLVSESGELEDPELGKMAILAGVHDYPLRVKCATLAWHTLHAALREQTETVTTE